MQGINNFWNNLFGGLPDVVVALLVLALAFFVAWLAKFLIIRLVKLVGLERGMKKAGIEDKNITKTSNFIGQLAYLIVFVLFLPGIFDKLGLNSISTPIVSMMNNFMAYLPNIIGALLIALVGIFAAKLIKELLLPLLRKTKLNEWLESIGLDTKKVDVSSVLVNLLYVVIVVFFVVEAFNTLQLDVLTNVGNQIIAYLPHAVSAAIIILLAYLLGNWIEKALADNLKFSRVSALVAKISIIVIGVFMTLYQLGIAPEMVNAAFIILLGGVAIAFAISFGIGSKEFAAHTMRKLEQKIDSSRTNKNRK